MKQANNNKEEVTTQKLEFKMVKVQLGEEEKLVESTTIKKNSSKLSEVIDKFFLTDEDYIREKIKERGGYGEAVGQGLRASVWER